MKTATSISAMIVRKKAVASNAPRRCTPQRFAKRIHFKQHFAKRIVRARAPGPNRIIAFPQRREQIAHRLQWTNHVFARAAE